MAWESRPRTLYPSPPMTVRPLHSFASPGACRTGVAPQNTKPPPQLSRPRHPTPTGCLAVSEMNGLGHWTLLRPRGVAVPSLALYGCKKRWSIVGRPTTAGPPLRGLSRPPDAVVASDDAVMAARVIAHRLGARRARPRLASRVRSALAFLGAVLGVARAGLELDDAAHQLLAHRPLVAGTLAIVFPAPSRKGDARFRPASTARLGRTASRTTIAFLRAIVPTRPEPAMPMATSRSARRRALEFTQQRKQSGGVFLVKSRRSDSP